MVDIGIDHYVQIKELENEITEAESRIQSLVKERDFYRDEYQRLKKTTVDVPNDQTVVLLSSMNVFLFG